MTDSLTLETPFLRLVVVPGFGARVTELTDRRTGRNWLPPGETRLKGPRYSDHGAGWDECFPTIAVDPDGGALRDHGTLWGLPVDCRAEDDTILSSHAHGGWLFERRLAVQDATVTADYRLTRTVADAKPDPWLWSQHCLLALRAGDRLVLDGLAPPEPPLDPRVADGPLPGKEAGFVQKTYARAHGMVSAGLDGKVEAIRFCWDGTEIPYAGLYICCGGHPAGSPRHQVAIEPATAPAECPSKAERLPVAPGESRSWQVRIVLSAG